MEESCNSSPQESHDAAPAAVNAVSMNKSSSSSSHDDEEEDDDVEIVCNACGFEEAYVPEGMIPCERCKSVYYCSVVCLQWDWKSGGHPDVCEDHRQDPDLTDLEADESVEDVVVDDDDEASKQCSVDDGTLISMDISHVFGTQTIQDTIASNKDMQNKQPSEQGSTSAVRERQKLWENKMRKAEAAKNDTANSDTKKKTPEVGLGAFFESQKKQHTPPPPPKQTPQPQERSEEQELDEDGSASIEIMDEPSDEDMLKSIVEEGSVSTEPDPEGSWRSRDLFEVPPPEPLLPAATSEHEPLHHITERSEQTDPSNDIPTTTETSREVTDEETETSISEEDVVDSTVTSGRKREHASSHLAKISVEPQTSVKRMKDMWESPKSKSHNVVTPTNDDLKSKAQVVGTTTVASASVANADIRPTNLERFSSYGSASTTATNISVNSGAKSFKDFRNLYEGPSNVKDFRNAYNDSFSQNDDESEQAIENMSRDPLLDKTDSNATSSSGGDTEGSAGDANALKISINKALRDYEHLYGPEAAKDAFKRLTQGSTNELEKMEPRAEVGQGVEDVRRETEDKEEDNMTESSGAVAGECSISSTSESGSSDSDNSSVGENHTSGEMSIDSTSESEKIEDSDGPESFIPGEMSIDSSSDNEPSGESGPPLGKKKGKSRLDDVAEEATATVGIADGLHAAGNSSNNSRSAVPASTVLNDASARQDTPVSTSVVGSSASRYLKYRTSLSSSAIMAQQQDGSTSPTEKSPTQQGASNADTSSEQHDSNFGAGAAYAAAGAAIASAGIVSGTITSKDSHQPPSDSVPSPAAEGSADVPAANESTSRYLKYRSSLTSSAVRTASTATEPKSEPSFFTQSEISGKTEDKSCRGVDPTIEKGAMDPAGAATSGVHAATCPSNGVPSNSAPGGTGGATTDTEVPSNETGPRYLSYRSSLAQNVPESNTATEIPAGAGSIAAAAQRLGSRDDDSFSESSDSEIDPRDDAAFQSKLSSYLMRSQIGSRHAAEAAVTSDGEPSAHSDFQSSWSGFDTEDLLEAEEAIEEKADTSKELAAAIAKEACDSHVLRSNRIVEGQGSEDAGKAEVLTTVSDSSKETIPMSGSVHYNASANDIESGIMQTSRESGKESSLEKAPTSASFCKQRRLLGYGAFLLVVVAIGLGIGLWLGVFDDGTEERGDSTQIEGNHTNTTTSAPTSAPTEVSVSPPTQSPSQDTETAAPTQAPTLSKVEETEPPTSTLAPTIAPTQSPTIFDVEDLFNLLRGVSVDNGDSILVEGTPQNTAFQWLAGSSGLTSLSDDRKIQRYALATLFYATDGENWSDRNKWVTDEDECTWFSRSINRFVCDGSDSVINLDLGFNQLGGQLVPEIALLTSLLRLDLSGGGSRSISGPMPTELGLLSSIRTFNIQNNNITGTIPDELGAWTNVEVVDMSSNQMSGAVPSTIGQMSALRELNLSGNNFADQLPSVIGQLGSLEFLRLGDNAFVGPLPTSVGQLSLLKDLSLEKNGFTSLPSEVGQLVNLITLNMSGNNMRGGLFTEMGELANLRSLMLHSSNLNGSIPTQIGLLVALEELNLSNNNLRGRIPESIGELVNLFYLQLQSNRLSGEIPISFESLERLTLIRLDDNDLTGTVPDEVCDVFSARLPQFYVDCATPEVTCPPGACCTYCCEDGVGCEMSV